MRTDRAVGALLVLWTVVVVTIELYAFAPRRGTNDRVIAGCELYVTSWIATGMSCVVARRAIDSTQARLHRAHKLWYLCEY